MVWTKFLLEGKKIGIRGRGGVNFVRKCSLFWKITKVHAEKIAEKGNKSI